MARDHWVVDRHIPVATIFAIVVQTAAMVWWGAGLTARVTELEAKAQHAAGHAERMAKLETRVEGIREGIAEIKGMLQARGSGGDPYRPALTR